MKVKLIAPCGMNCNLCIAYLRDNNKCPGCRVDSKDKNRSCTACIIKGCDHLKNNNLKYCSNKCSQFPCKRLKGLDKRYRTKYDMSMLDNLEYIEKNGIRNFLQNKKDRWVRGDEVFCVHHKKYFKLN
jgi:hypothetical protein